MKADVVIGAGFGDEGKGLMTDYLASQHDESIVIRFNGGAQAGHTVQTDTKLHVFSHFGSGTLANAHTYLSQFFITNPFIFIREAVELVVQGIALPKVMIHPHSIVTTPYDMFVNQLQAKGNTCGLGINETIVRHEYFPITVGQLWSWKPEAIRLALIDIRDNYTRQRLAHFNIHLDPGQEEVFTSEQIIVSFIRDVKEMLSHATVAKLRNPKVPVIFEGAQGLLLDNDYDVDFGTPSKTGLKNVITIAKELGIDHLDVNYMIRAYMSRHGDGPFPTHNPALIYADETNVTNRFQGSLRFGMHDHHLIAAAIYDDRTRCDLSHTTRLVVTHLDQMPNYIEYQAGGEVHTVQKKHFAMNMARGMRLDGYAESYGPTRKDIRCPT